MTYFTLIFISFSLGCLSTLVIIIGLYICFGLSTRGPVMKPEQYQTFHPINENHHSKNSTVDTVNYIAQFLFQELKDTARVRRHAIKVINREIQDFKETKLAKLLLEDISILSFSLGKECPVFSDIQLERQERDKRRLIKEVGARVNFEYKDGFAATLDIKLRFGYKCQIYVKIKRVRGQARIEFRREPYSHWLAVFQDEPTIDFELKSYFSSRESSQLAQIITQQIRRVIRRKLTWPSYKIRYEPFFSRSRKFIPIEKPPIHRSLIPGTFVVELIECDRLSIPYELYSRKNFLLFITFSINERTCEEDFCFDRKQWTRKTIEFIPKNHRINVKDVLFMNRTEYLIESFHSLLDSVKHADELQNELADKKVFLLQIDDKDVKNLKQINSYFHENIDKQIRICVGIPLLNCIQVQQEQNLDDDDVPTTSTTSKNLPTEKLSLMTINKESLDRFQVKEITIKVLDTYVNFNSKAKETFTVGDNQHFLNICLWCESPNQPTNANIDHQRVLLGYTSVALSEIVVDAHMNFNRETQMTLNFQTTYFNSRVPSEKLNELRTHKGYDENLTHGFVTVNVKHQPRVEGNMSDSEDTDEFTSVDEDNEESPPIPNNHNFMEKQFSRKTMCGSCKRKIWMKTAFQCQNCLICVHKKCVNKFSQQAACIHSPQIPIIDDDISIDETLLRDDNTKKSVRASRIANAASSAYSTLRRLKPKQSTMKPENRRSPDVDISETDLQDIITKCLSEDDINSQSLEELFRTKALDHSVVYTRANEYGAKLFEGLTNDQRRAKIESEISRLKEEIDLQNEIRDELFIEYNSKSSDENVKKKLNEKIENTKEKIQALGSLTIFYCSCLRYCNSDNECKDDNSKNFDSD